MVKMVSLFTRWSAAQRDKTSTQLLIFNPTDAMVCLTGPTAAKPIKSSSQPESRPDISGERTGTSILYHSQRTRAVLLSLQTAVMDALQNDTFSGSVP